VSRRIAGAALAVGLILAAATPAHAYNPSYGCGDDLFLWRDGGARVPFHPDQGDLGPIAHADAVALVQSAGDVWRAVPTSTIQFVNGGLLPVDVDVSNFAPYLFAEAPDGLSAVVFDHTGEIFDLLYGADSGILGFAGPEWGSFHDNNCEIVEGLAFLNGPAFTDLTYALDVTIHELGHYVNLDHTVVNGQMFLGDASGPTPNDTFGRPVGIEVVETMYPFYFGPNASSGTLAADDVAGISTLYPEPGFLSGTGSIHGTVYAQNGATRVNGVNVIARNVADPFGDAVSSISGSFTSGTTQEDPLVGTYVLNGLTPGATYAVYVDRIFAGEFSTLPTIVLPGPEEFHSGNAESNNLASADPVDQYAPVAVTAGAPQYRRRHRVQRDSAGGPHPVRG
jgi:hypothetical protein